MQEAELLRAAFGQETVANPGFGLDVFPVGIALEFFAQLANEDAEILGLLCGLSAPDGGEQGAVGEDFAGVAGEEKKQVEFLGCEMNGTAGDGDGVGTGIDEKVANFNGAIAGTLGRTAKMGAHAGEELLNAERLGDVVVGAGIEGLHFGVLLIAHGEDEDGCAGFAANRAGEINAGHAGHHQVGDDEVGVPFFKETEGFLGIVGGADVVTLRGERGAQDACDLNFVVHHEDAFGHGSSRAIPESAAGL